MLFKSSGSDFWIYLYSDNRSPLKAILEVKASFALVCECHRELPLILVSGYSGIVANYMWLVNKLEKDLASWL